MWRTRGQSGNWPRVATDFATLVDKERGYEVTGASGESQVSGDSVRQVARQLTVTERPQLAVSDSVIWLSVGVFAAPSSLPVRSSVGHFVVSESVIWLSAGGVGR
jgi:hypothetical protein